MANTQKFFPWLVMISVLWLAAGCTAVFDATINPSYEKPVNEKQLSQTTRIFIEKVKSNSPFPAEGIKKNGLGMVTAQVESEPPPEEILTQALKLELDHAGFIVTDGPEDSFRLRVTINQFFVEPQVSYFYAAFCGAIQCEITLVAPSGYQYRRSFKKVDKLYTPIWSSTLPIWGDNVYESTLQFTLQDFMKKVMQEVVFLVEQIEP